MKGVITLLLAMAIASCSPDSDTGGTVYSGRVNLNTRLKQFTATNEDTKEDIVLTMTGPHELTFSLDDKISHLDYEKDIIIIRSEADNSEWSAKKVKRGYELEDGTTLKLDDCPGWTICLHDSGSVPILKGKYSLQGNGVEVTLWISDHEKHVELLGLMANALLNKSRDAKQSTDAALETLSSQVWTY
jgi:hypothetical protein